MTNVTDGSVVWVVKTINDFLENTDIIAIKNGGTGTTNAANACKNLGALPLSGGTVDTLAIKSAHKYLGDNYTMNVTDFDGAGIYAVTSFSDDNRPEGDLGDWYINALTTNSDFRVMLAVSPRIPNKIFIGHFWNGIFDKWYTIA